MNYRKLLVIAAVILLVVGAVLVPLYLTGDGGTAWTYDDPKGFRLKLPSDEWKQVSTDTGLTAFANRKRSLQVQVRAEPQSRKEFLEKTVPDLKASLVAKRALIVGNPEFVQGENAAGNPYVLCRFQARMSRQGGAGWVAVSATWCQRKELLVLVEMVQDSAGNAVAQDQGDAEFFEQASKSICLSVE